jgi:hypothetical protein
MLRPLILGLIALTALSYADEPFSVSLVSASTDLTPCYAAAVREATQEYRGDGTGTIILMRSSPVFREIPGGIWLEEQCFEARPFTAELLTLRETTQLDIRASSQTMQLTQESR